MKKEEYAKINPIRIGNYKPPSSLIGRIKERYEIMANIHPGIREIRTSDELGCHHYQLPDLIGYYIGNVLIDDGKFVYIDKIDHRRVDVSIRRVIGGYWEVTAINEHIMQNSHNGTLRPLSKLELMIK